MTNPYAESSSEHTAAIVVGAVTPGRVTKEQLAAAERARLYHINKLAAFRAPAALPDEGMGPVIVAAGAAALQPAPDAGGGI